MMKVLLINNFYQSSAPSGEDAVFGNELELLRRNGVEVVSYVRHNDDILKQGILEKATLPLTNIWSVKSQREIKNLIRREKPDICHFHNIFYLISPSALYSCKELGVPVVLTLHNFRLFCANGLLLRNGEVCEDCLGHYPFRGIIHGCYRNSRLYSLPVSLMEYVHQVLGTWEKKVDAFIALTNFSKGKYMGGGLPEDKIFVKPNFLPDPVEPEFTPGDCALYVGRLAEEKGMMTLLEAWRRLENITLRIIGDGPMKKDILHYVEKNNMDNVSLVGRVPRDQVIEYMKDAMFLVFPSEWYEGFPMTLVEAYASGKPVLASGMGVMEEIIKDGETGFLFEPKNSEDLADKVARMWKNREECMKMGKRAREEFEKYYTPDRNFKILMDIYQRVLH
jgi:glycosyltransferase involved in cell wall biosynthesis